MTCILIAALIALSGIKPDCNGGWPATAACTCNGGLMDN